MKTTYKLDEFGFDLLPHPPYSPDLASSVYLLLIDLKKIHQGKRIDLNEEVIAATEAFLSYTHGIEKLENRW